MSFSRGVKGVLGALLRKVPDEAYLHLYFRAMTGKRLRLNPPVTFNEKMQWLKLHDRNPLYTRLVDKYEVRAYIEKKIGAEYLIPMIGLWRRAEDIDFDSLPERFVLKCTHDSGSVLICPDRRSFDAEAARKKLRASLARNMYFNGREWPYRDVEPRIIGEEFLCDESGRELKDYKLFCFGGEPKLIQVDFDRFSSHKRNLHTTGWDYIPMEICYPTASEVQIPKPAVLEEMLEKARVLSKGFAFVRLDFYIVGRKLYFGEITLYHGSGVESFRPEEWDRKLGDSIDLSLAGGS